MNSQRIFGGIVAAAIGLAMMTIPARAAAEECRQACGAVASTAVSEGKAALKSCKLDCRSDAEPATCRADCRAAAKQARRAVKASLVECSQTCQPTNSCEEQCLAPARECLAPILDQARSCTRDCAGIADDAAAACASAVDPLACLQETAHQMHMCVQGCATTTRDGAEACKAALQDCNAGCAPATECEGQCVPSLHGCLEPVVVQARQCGEQCAGTARAAAAACLSQSDPAACLAQVAQQLAQCAIGCKNDAEQEAQQCRATFEGCVHDCLPPDPCRDACFGDLQQCVAPIVSDTRTCGIQCAGDALAAATACLNAQDRMACLLEVEHALGVCAQGCAHSARERGDVCRGDFRQCADACGPLGDGTCRGVCLAETGQCLVPVAEEGRTCVGTCAKNAAPHVLPCLSGPAPAACLGETVQQLLQCAQACKPAAQAGAAQCRAGLDACVQQCPADPCQDGCVASLEECVASTAGLVEGCATTCITRALNAGSACLSQPNPLLCLGRVAQEGLLCGADCRATARTEGAACWSGYRGCAQACGQ